LAVSRAVVDEKLAPYERLIGRVEKVLEQRYILQLALVGNFNT